MSSVWRAGRLAEQRAQLGSPRGVHRGQRLVHDEDSGLGGQGPGDGHPLALAARQRRRAPLPERGVHPDAFEHLTGPPPGRGPIHPGPAQPERHIVDHSEVPEQPVVLEHHARAAKVSGHEQPGVGVVGHRVPDHQAAAGQAVEPGHSPPQRRLARAVAPDYRGHALADHQIVNSQHPRPAGYVAVELDGHRGVPGEIGDEMTPGGRNPAPISAVSPCVDGGAADAATVIVVSTGRARSPARSEPLPSARG